MKNCKIIKWHHLSNIEWNDYLIDDNGKIWHNDKKVKEFSYTVYFSKGKYVDIRPYVMLPTERGFTKIPVHVLQMQSSLGYLQRT